MLADEQNMQSKGQNQIHNALPAAFLVCFFCIFACLPHSKHIVAKGQGQNQIHNAPLVPLGLTQAGQSYSVC